MASSRSALRERSLRRRDGDTPRDSVAHWSQRNSRGGQRTSKKTKDARNKLGETRIKRTSSRSGNADAQTNAGSLSRPPIGSSRTMTSFLANERIAKPLESVQAAELEEEYGNDLGLALFHWLVENNDVIFGQRAHRQASRLPSWRRNVETAWDWPCFIGSLRIMTSFLANDTVDQHGKPGKQRTVQPSNEQKIANKTMHTAMGARIDSFFV